MRLCVFAYHEVGYVCLEELIRQGEEISCVVTHRDDPGEKIWFRSVAELARSHNLPVLFPEDLSDPGFQESLRRMRPDLIFSFYYRKLLPPALLAIPPRGCINLHGSLLPRYRGRSPINWVLVNGEKETGVTLHYMEETPDSGDIIAQRVVPITLEDTALTLSRKVAEAARLLLQDTYPLIRDGRAPRTPQRQEEATYYGKRRPEDGRIQWSRSAREIYNLIRAVTHPFPGAFTEWEKKRLYVWTASFGEGTVRLSPPGTILSVCPGEGFSVATGEGVFCAREVQLEGEDVVRGDQFLERWGIPPFTRLG